MPKIVRLLGCARSTVTLPPIEQGEERWGMNSLSVMKHAGDYTGWTRWFDVHSREHIQAKRPAAWEWYTQQTTGMIYLRDAHAEIPRSRAFPYEALMEGFGTAACGPERYFLSSLDWMIALALFSGFHTIHLHYFELRNELYQYQVPSARYWIGRARSTGREVIVHPPSQVIPSNRLYGIEETDADKLIDY